MGFRWQRRVNRGRNRVNLSGRGMGWSWGFPGFRIGVTATGRWYYSIGLPGSGLRYFKRL